MENKKTKGGTEKARIKERKALETHAAKWAKIGSFFNQTCSRSETTNEDDETSPQIQDASPSTSHEPTGPECAESEAEPGASGEEETGKSRETGGSVKGRAESTQGLITEVAAQQQTLNHKIGMRQMKMSLFIVWTTLLALSHRIYI
ncbi:unnamed protein product [Arctogadus glacialis]